jgi:hypothetical protein
LNFWKKFCSHFLYPYVLYDLLVFSLISLITFGEESGMHLSVWIPPIRSITTILLTTQAAGCLFRHKMKTVCYSERLCLPLSAVRHSLEDLHRRDICVVSV